MSVDVEPMSAKWQQPFWLKGPAFEDSGSILRSFEGSKQSRLFVHKAAEAVHKKVTIWFALVVHYRKSFFD